MSIRYLGFGTDGWRKNNVSGKHTGWGIWFYSIGEMFFGTRERDFGAREDNTELSEYGCQKDASREEWAPVSRKRRPRVALWHIVRDILLF
jgi:hypothetical protein